MATYEFTFPGKVPAPGLGGGTMNMTLKATFDKPSSEAGPYKYFLTKDSTTTPAFLIAAGAPVGWTLSGGHALPIRQGRKLTDAQKAKLAADPNRQTHTAGTPLSACLLAQGSFTAHGTPPWAELPAKDKKALLEAVTKWKAAFPSAPAPLFLYGTGGGGVSYYLLRPESDYPAELMIEPPIPPGDPHAAIFSTMFRIFYPDWFFVSAAEAQGSGYALGAGSVVSGFAKPNGSITPYGPYPYWAKMFTSAEIDFAVQYIQTPGAFGDPTTHERFSELASSANAFRKGVAIGGAYGGAILAVADFLSNVFDSSPPQPPPWLTALAKIQTLRKSTVSANSTVIPFANRQVKCQWAKVDARGDYDLFGAYDEMMKRLAGKKAVSKWLWALLAAGTALAVGG